MTNEEINKLVVKALEWKELPKNKMFPWLNNYSVEGGVTVHVRDGYTFPESMDLCLKYIQPVLDREEIWLGIDRVKDNNEWEVEITFINYKDKLRYNRDESLSLAYCLAFLNMRGLV